MKTKDLIQKINGILRMNAKIEEKLIVIYEDGMDFSFYNYPINGKSRGDGYSNFINLTSIYMKDLFELLDYIDEYRRTPLAEREEEKRYYLRYDVPPLLRTARTKPLYFVISRIDRSPDVSYSQMEYEGFQKIFTESEIAEMDTTGFELVEVEG